MMSDGDHIFMVARSANIVPTKEGRFSLIKRVDPLYLPVSARAGKITRKENGCIPVRSSPANRMSLCGRSHTRMMPVILPEKHHDAWLSEEARLSWLSLLLATPLTFLSPVLNLRLSSASSRSWSDWIAWCGSAGPPFACKYAKSCAIAEISIMPEE